MSEARHDVLILSGASFQQRLGSIDKEIRRQDVVNRYHEKRIQNVKGREDDRALKDAERLLEETKNKKKRLMVFHQEFST